MQISTFIHATEVAAELGISDSHSYKRIREMNKEMRNKGFLVLKGRISKKYFYEKIYGKEGRK